MELHPRTLATLQGLRKVEWFRSIGQAKGQHIVAATNWEEALEWNNDGTWEEVQIEGANQVRLALSSKSIQDFQRWNDVVRNVKPVTTELVQEKIREVVERERLDQDFENSVLWDILHLALEAEFSEVIAPGFFAQLGYWYQNGNWPCGWQGPMDKGQLVVF